MKDTVRIGWPQVNTVMKSATTTATGVWCDKASPLSTVQAFGTTSSGAGAATIAIDATNNQSGSYVTLGTISLTLSTSASTDGFVVEAPWKYIRARVTAISGTGAAVTVEVAS